MGQDHHVKENLIIKEDFNELLELLRNAKIVHTDPLSLARHLDEIWSNPERWWSSRDVIIARERFNDLAISVPKDSIDGWLRFLRNTGSEY